MVGAGAAGLTAALRAAEGGARVTLLNAHPKVGLKILMSGGTRCNVTHREVTERDYHGGSPAVVRRMLRAFTPQQTLEWMASLGVELKLEETGKYFPISDDAQTVLDALLNAVRGAGVSVESGARVVRIERPDAGGFRLGVQKVQDSAQFEAVRAQGLAEFALPAAEPERWLIADAVILATGGLSFPRTGSDGAGYALAQALRHTIEPTIPALTPLTSSDALCGRLQGLTLEAELRLAIGGKLSKECARGSFLFTHFGYSGPAALDFSRHWLRAEGTGERRAFIDFLPGTAVSHTDEALQAVGRTEPRVTLRRALARSLPERLVDALLQEIAIDGWVYVSQLPRDDRARLVAHLRGREVPITGTLGYEKAEVTAGGVRLAEVDPSTLESRVVPGMFLCGEILDVEGRLGGFNFQFAWSSGTVAGRAASS